MSPQLIEQDADAAATAQHAIWLLCPNRQELSSASRRSQMSDEGAVIYIFDQPSHNIKMRPKHKPWLMIMLTLVQIGLTIYNNKFSSANTGDKPEDSPQTSYNRSRLFEILIFDNQLSKTQIWRFVTYMLVHTEWIHLYGNMLVQLLLGVPLEIYNGWWRVLVVYLAGGVAGCLGHAMFQDGVLSGASAGDLALVTAQIASAVINWRELEHGLLQIFLSFIYCIISLIVAVEDSNCVVSHVSHLCGGIAGLLVGFCVLQNLVIRKWEETLKIVAMTTFFVLLLGSGIFFYATLFHDVTGNQFIRKLLTFKLFAKHKCVVTKL